MRAAGIIKKKIYHTRWTNSPVNDLYVYNSCVYGKVNAIGTP